MKKNRTLWAVATFALFCVLALAFASMGLALSANPLAGAAVVSCGLMALGALVVGALAALDVVGL